MALLYPLEDYVHARQLTASNSWAATIGRVMDGIRFSLFWFVLLGSFYLFLGLGVWDEQP